MHRTQADGWASASRRSAPFRFARAREAQGYGELAGPGEGNRCNYGEATSMPYGLDVPL